jgi:hypothetical protein
VDTPTPADPEIASATFIEHLDRLWATGRPERAGWLRWPWDPLHAIVRLPARRDCGAVDYYLLRLGATYYDAFPPTASFVSGDGATEARQGTSAYPSIAGAPWFSLHDSYEYPDKTRRQLVCISVTAEYYWSHVPSADVRWEQGKHTVAATLNRLAELLAPPYYKGPSG